MKTVFVPLLVWFLAYNIGCSADSRVVATRPESEGDNRGGRIEEGADSEEGQTPVALIDAGATTSANAPDVATDAAGGPPVKTVIDQTGADNPAGLSDDEVKQLIAGGPIGELRWLYPYSGTVFPGRMLAPTLMWQGVDTDAVYLRINSSTFEYKTVITPSVAQESLIQLGQTSDFVAQLQPQFQIPQEVWNIACEKTQGRADPFTVELSARIKGVVAGPVALNIIIAKGSVRGSIYYTSYYSKLAASVSQIASGALLHIPPEGTAEVLMSNASGTCVGCHSISANGSRLVLQGLKIGSGLSDTSSIGYCYDLDPATGATHPNSINGYNAGLAAVYPDGSKYLAQAQGFGAIWSIYTVADRLNQIWSYNTNATLYNATTGEVIPDTDIPVSALMPMFSPDGSRLVFNEVALAARALAVMDYDSTQDKASNYQVLAAEASDSPYYPGWPSFLPDNQAVVFERTENAQFGGFVSEIATSVTTLDPSLIGQPVSDKAAKSDLYIVDTTTGRVTILAKAMGFDNPSDFDTDTTYLPFGISDLHHNYNTTVSPVASGGYFWVFFDSPRNYSDLIARFPSSEEARLARVSLGKLLLSRGAAEAAEREFRRYLEETRGQLSEEALVNWARSLRAMRRDADEKRAWQKLLAEYPESVYAVQANHRLKLLSENKAKD